MAPGWLNLVECHLASRTWGPHWEAFRHPFNIPCGFMGSGVGKYYNMLIYWDRLPPTTKENPFKLTSVHLMHSHWHFSTFLLPGTRMMSHVHFCCPSPGTRHLIHVNKKLCLETRILKWSELPEIERVYVSRGLLVAFICPDKITVCWTDARIT